MSTTVIASRLSTLRLLLAPWLAPSVDRDAVRAVAAEHGVDLFDPAELDGALEVIAASGLEPSRAAPFAAALRAVGLTVRVVNEVPIRQSARLGGVLAAQILFAALTVPLVVPAIVALFNAAYVAMRGMTLPLVGSPADPNAPAARVLQQLRALRDELPSHVLDPIVAEAEALSRDAATAPDGPAARALRELASDLEQDRQAEVEHAARSVRQQLALARRAARETR